MTDGAVKRPPMLAGACLYLGTLAVIMAIRAVTVVSSWNAESRAADFSDTLRALRDAGLSASGAETFYKTVVTVVAVLAACGAVFALYTARGHRASRVGMTIVIAVAGVLTFLGVLGGTFLFSMVGALAVVFTIRLWTGENRTYFRTLAGHAPPAPAARKADPFAAAVPPVTTEAPTPPAPPMQGYAPPPGYYPPTKPGREPLPRSVGIAVWTTFVGSIVAAGLSGLMLLALLVTGLDYDMVIDQGGPGADMIGSEDEFDVAIRFLTTLSAIAVVLGLAGLIASIRVLMTRRSGGVVLFVLAVSTLVVSVVGFPIGLPWTAAAIVTLVQLRKPDARAWFSRT